MDQHIDRVLSTTSSTLFALGTLRLEGLPTTTLHQITYVTTLTSIMYASPARWGYSNTHNRDRIEDLFCRMKRLPSQRWPKRLWPNQQSRSCIISSHKH